MRKINLSIIASLITLTGCQSTIPAREDLGLLLQAFEPSPLVMQVYEVGSKRELSALVDRFYTQELLSFELEYIEEIAEEGHFLHPEEMKMQGLIGSLDEPTGRMALVFERMRTAAEKGFYVERDGESCTALVQRGARYQENLGRAAAACMHPET